MSLDGYFEGTKPWALEFHGSVWGDELEAFSLQQGDEIGTLLFGRRTYEGMARYWQAETGPIADMMNSLEKAVITRTLEAADWSNTRLLKGEAAEQARALKDEVGKKDIYVFGSAELVAELLNSGLVDEYRLCVAPVILGKGTPLFKPSNTAINMKLKASRRIGTDAVVLYFGLERGAVLATDQADVRSPAAAPDP